MSDTMTVKTLCDHGRADPHHINLGTAVCPGGKEIILRPFVAGSFDDGDVHTGLITAWVEVPNAGGVEADDE